MTEIPTEWNTYRCKAMWAGTSTTYLIEARDESHAKERCYQQLDKTMGGDSCLKVVVLGVTN